MDNASHSVFRQPVKAQSDECARACEHCAALCEHTLRADPSYYNSIERFSEEQLLLISFSSVCRLTADALRDAREDAGEMCAWCVQVCADFALRVRVDALKWRRFDAAVRNCSTLCAAVAARSARRPIQANAAPASCGLRARRF
jgi:hypothetical protein